MEEEKDETLDSTKETEDTEKVNEDESADDKSEETGDKDKPKYSDNEKKLYARMKTAEADAKLAKEELAKFKSTEKPAPVGDIDKLLDAKLEKRDIESLELSDSLKKEVQTYAKVQGISVKKALNSDYISFLKEKEEKKERIDNASLGSNRKGTKKDYSKMTASDFDLKTPEGKADFAKYEEHLRKELG
jgi:hypothetical protein